MHRYEFSDENKEYLLSFLQVAKVTNKKCCDLMEHQILTEFLPINIHLQNKIASMNQYDDVINITDSDEEEMISNNFGHSQTQIPLIKEGIDIDIQTSNGFTADDTLNSIKEHLRTEKKLSGSILNNLNSLLGDQHKMFGLLSELKLEEVINFGISLKSNICSDYVISYYIRYLLLEKLTLEYSDQLQHLLDNFSIKCSENLLEEITQILLQKETYSKVFLQFIDGLNMDFKQKLLRKFIFTCEKFQENYFSVIEILIVPQIAEFDTLSKLFEIVSNNENNFNMDKCFGKFLMNLIKLLGKHVALFEQPLKHVIGCHKSIWKAKLQKTIDDCLQENSMLSQSIKY